MPPLTAYALTIVPASHEVVRVVVVRLQQQRTFRIITRLSSQLDLCACVHACMCQRMTVHTEWQQRAEIGQKRTQAEVTKTAAQGSGRTSALARTLHQLLPTQTGKQAAPPPFPSHPSVHTLVRLSHSSAKRPRLTHRAMYGCAASGAWPMARVARSTAFWL